MRVRLVAGPALALLLAVSASGCGGDPEDEADPPPASGSSSASASSTPSSPRSTSDEPSAASTSAPVTGTGGKLLLVPADSPGTGRCSPAPRRGVVCSADRRTTYRFQPDAVSTVAVQSVTGEYAARSGWVLRVSVADAGRTTLTQLSRQAQRTRQFLLLLVPGSRKLISAPMVNQPISGGELQITGDLSERDVRRFVRQITSAGG